MDNKASLSTTECWWTIKEAARYLNVSTGFMRKAVRNRTIPFVRLGTKALRFRRAELDRWIESNGVANHAT